MNATQFQFWKVSLLWTLIFENLNRIALICTYECIMSINYYCSDKCVLLSRYRKKENIVITAALGMSYSLKNLNVGYKLTTVEHWHPHVIANASEFDFTLLAYLFSGED